jgi:hypothetical protein
VYGQGNVYALVIYIAVKGSEIILGGFMTRMKKRE